MSESPWKRDQRFAAMLGFDPGDESGWIWSQINEVKRAHFYDGENGARQKVTEILMKTLPPPELPQRGCICPGDATPYCQNQLCPRKAIAP